MLQQMITYISFVAQKADFVNLEPGLMERISGDDGQTIYYVHRLSEHRWCNRRCRTWTAKSSLDPVIHVSMPGVGRGADAPCALGRFRSSIALLDCLASQQRLVHGLRSRLTLLL